MRNPRSESSATLWALGLLTALAAVVLPVYRHVLSLDVVTQLALVWLWLGLWSVAAWGIGAPLERAHTGGSRDPVLVLATGSAALALFGAGLAWVRLFRPPVLLLALATAVAWGIVEIVRRPPVLPRSSSPAWIAVAVIGLAAVAIGVGNPAPPVMYDTLNYHLAFPARWLRAGGFVEFPRHFYSYFPAAAGMLYAWALAGVGAWGAKALHLWAGLLAAGAAGRLGRNLLGERAGAWAAVLFFLTPSVLTSASFATCDLFVAAWGGAALLLFIDRQEGRGISAGRALLWSGFLAGAAAAAKYIALATVVPPVAACGALLLCRERRRTGEWLGGAALFAAGAALSLAPWLIRNVSWTGNPLYPYLRSLFGGPFAGVSVATELLQNGSPVQGPWGFVVSIVGALVVRTFRPLQVGGNIGPLWLMLLPVAVLLAPLRRRRAWLPLVVATGVGLAAWGGLVQFGRFLLPVLVPAAALAGGAAAELTRGPGFRLARRTAAALLASVLLWNATTVFDRLSVARRATAVGVLPAESFLRRWVSSWPGLRYCNEHVPDDGKVLLVAESRSFYLNRDVVVEDPYHTPLLVELARKERNASQLRRRLRTMGVTHLLVNRREMPRFAALRGLPSYWTEADPALGRVLEELFQDQLDLVFDEQGVQVFRLP